MSYFPRRKLCVERCIDQNKAEIASMKGTSVWHEHLDPYSLTATICRSKCKTLENKFAKCEKKGWKTCQGSLRECEKTIEQQCRKALSE